MDTTLAVCVLDLFSPDHYQEFLDIPIKDPRDATRKKPGRKPGSKVVGKTALTNAERQKAFKNINKPAVYDYLESVRGSVYQPLNIPSIVQSVMETQTSSIPIHEITQINKKHDGSDKLVSTETLNVMSEIVKRKKAMEDKEKKIDHFCIEFKERYSRDPTEDEIVENLENEQEKITKAIISGFVSKAREKRLKKNSINTNHVNEINGINQIDEINETKYTNDINENKIVKNDSVIIDIPSNI
jgi:hypothetical protein